jgi:predicted ATPase with chaperone activity
MERPESSGFFGAGPLNPSARLKTAEELGALPLCQKVARSSPVCVGDAISARYPARMNSPHLPALDRRLATLLRSAVQELNLSARTYSRILIVARRIADWAQADKIETPHLLEAIQFCTLSGEL